MTIEQNIVKITKFISTKTRESSKGEKNRLCSFFKLHFKKSSKWLGLILAAASGNNNLGY
jgi:hypothetical protein